MIRPRQLVHAGRVVAHGVWLSPDVVAESVARRRVLSWTRNGGRTMAIDGGYFVQLSGPKPMFVDDVDIAPVLQVQGLWLAVPLRDDELARIAAPPGSFVYARGGRACIVPPNAQRTADLASWIDVGGFELVDAEPVADADPAHVETPRLIAPSKEVADIRELVSAKVPPPAAERDDILRTLRAAADRTSGGGRLGRGFFGPGEVGPFAGTPRDDGGIFGALDRWLRSWLGPAPTGQLAGSTPSGDATPPSPPSEGWLRRWLRRRLAASRLAEFLGRRQAHYLERMLKMFEDGDIDDALRHAIPFGSLPGAPQPPSLSVPSPRSELRLTPHAAPAPATSLNLGDDLYERFKDLYRKAARDLEAAGRVEEAAYVMFDLLGENDEGVAMLERHDKYELAAQMAEGRGLEAGLVIRLWFLAGKADRAIAVAKRTGAYSDAIARLQDARPELARALRVHWADRLAGAGDFAAAVDAVWPEPDARRIAYRWIDMAIEFGGPTAMRMLPRKLALFGPLDSEGRVRREVAAAVQAITHRRDEEAVVLRQELGNHWAQLERPWPSGALAIGRGLARQLMVDAHAEADPEAARHLLSALKDPVLSLEAEGLAVPPRPAPTVVTTRVFAAHERGLSEVSDAVELSNGRLVLALGDAGIRVVDRDGHTLRRYEHPATQLVRADAGTQLIAVIERGRTSTFTRLDLVSGRAERWCDARVHQHATSYDGATWFLTTTDAVVAVDVQAAGLQALWRVGQIDDPLLAIARDRDNLALCLHGRRAQVLAIWRFELTAAGPKLRGRLPVDLSPDLSPAFVRAWVHPSGRLFATIIPTADSDQPRYVSVGPSDKVTIAPGHDDVAVLPRHEHVLIARRTETGSAIEVHQVDYLGLGTTSDTLRVRLEGSKKVRLRDDDSCVLISDDLGRVIKLDERLAVERVWLL